jgi:hypothetical protein
LRQALAVVLALRHLQECLLCFELREQSLLVLMPMHQDLRYLCFLQGRLGRTHFASTQASLVERAMRVSTATFQNSPSSEYHQLINKC